MLRRELFIIRRLQFELYLIQRKERKSEKLRSEMRPESQKQDLAEKKFRTMQMKKRTIWTKNFHCFAITVQPDLHRPKEKILEQ